LAENENPTGLQTHLSSEMARDLGWILEFSGIFARVSFIACICSVIVASLIGAPHILYSYHLSHFAVLYLLALTVLAAFPDWSILKTFWALVAFVTALGVARILIRHHVEINFLDWIADLSGILGGLAPVVVQRLREVQVRGR